MNITKNNVDYKIIMLVVENYYHVEDRISKLIELGYDVDSLWVKSGGIGAIRTYHKREGVQISAAVGGNSFVGKAYVAFK